MTYPHMVEAGWRKDLMLVTGQWCLLHIPSWVLSLLISSVKVGNLLNHLISLDYVWTVMLGDNFSTYESLFYVSHGVLAPPFFSSTSIWNDCETIWSFGLECHHKDSIQLNCSIPSGSKEAINIFKCCLPFIMSWVKEEKLAFNQDKGEVETAWDGDAFSWKRQI